MTVCFGFIPPPIALPLFILISIILIYFLIYKPFKNKKEKSTKIKSIISFIILFSLFSFLIFFSVDTCYYTFKPNFVKDFNVQITSEQQAKQIFYDVYTQEFNNIKQQNSTHFEFLTNFSLSRIRENQESYSVYFNNKEYILNKDGKLYKRFVGE